MAEDGFEERVDDLSDGDLVAALQATQRRMSRGLAEQYRVIAGLDARVRRRTREQAAGRFEPVRAQASECVDDVVTVEVQTALGIRDSDARALVEHARVVVHVAPRLLAALSEGVLDVCRVRAVLDAVDLLDDDGARQVVDTLLDKLAADEVSAAWGGPSPRAWRERIAKAVVRADPDAARRRYEAAVAARRVRTWPNGDGTGTFQACGPAKSVSEIDQILQQLAQQQPEADADGVALRMDQRRWQAFEDLFRAAAAGEPLPTVAVRREREVGIVLNADTFFADGPAADEPGQLQGLGAPAVLDPTTARELAAGDLAAGRSAAVLLVGADGKLERLVRLRSQPVGGWTRSTLVDAVRRKLPDLPPLRIPGYSPTSAIAEHVRAAYPTCTAYDCPRTSRQADVDHEDPWPRGPTCVTNLNPKCRKHHNLKTLGLHKSRLNSDGSVTWTSMLGTTITSRPEPLPGC